MGGIGCHSCTLDQHGNILSCCGGPAHPSNQVNATSTSQPFSHAKIAHVEHPEPQLQELFIGGRLQNLYFSVNRGGFRV